MQRLGRVSAGVSCCKLATERERGLNRGTLLTKKCSRICQKILRAWHMIVQLTTWCCRSIMARGIMTCIFVRSQPAVKRFQNRLPFPVGFQHTPHDFRACVNLCQLGRIRILETCQPYYKPRLLMQVVHFSSNMIPFSFFDGAKPSLLK